MIESTSTLTDRTVLRAGGAEWRELFDRLVTNRTPKDGEAVSAALLTPQGKVAFDFLMIGDADEALIDIPADAAEAFVKRMNLYKLRSDVTLEATDMRVATATDGGFAGGGRVVPDPRHCALGVRAYGADVTGESLHEHQARRRGLGVAEGAEIPPNALFAAEANLDLLHGVDFKKGCFVGQEVVSRMRRKTQVRRRLLAFAADGVLETDAEITAGETRMGEVVSLHEGGGFASIRLDRLAEADGMDLTAGDHTVRLIMPDWLPAPVPAA